MRVYKQIYTEMSVAPLTPKVMHMPHSSADNLVFTLAVADAAASVLYNSRFWFLE